MRKGLTYVPKSKSSFRSRMRVSHDVYFRAAQEVLRSGEAAPAWTHGD